MNMTSNCDVTKSHTKYEPPHENFLRTPLAWLHGSRKEAGMS